MLSWLFCYQRSEYGFWFRLFGFGLSFRSADRYPMVFSERSGIATAFHVFGLVVRPLHPWKIRGSEIETLGELNKLLERLANHSPREAD